ncbi:MAG: proton-conducting transporter membrane subunit, partial [Rhodomicrobium sp.]
MYPAIVFMPLAGALIAGLFGRILGDRVSGVLTSLLVLAGAVLSWIAFYKVGIEGEDAHIALLPWIGVGDLQTSWALRVDTLTAVMLVVVNTVSALVHIYSIGYMSEDDRQPLFFAELSLFTFAMLALVTADNFVQLFFGWEGVGLASYLLIGFWYHRPSANAAAIKAFVVNRVGDFGFALGIFAVFYVFREVNFDTVFAAAREKQSLMLPVFGYQADALT